ncbi:MAG: glycosyltransferase family 92 protein [Alphaproteobacteria bacterium]|nr:glycosyltransferase family 92 protein [Alphaproteobacteria bacterium]
MKYYLSVCAIFRNEAYYLREWIEFHRIVGVDHFFLYNNFSDDSFVEVLRGFDSNVVSPLNCPVSMGTGGLVAAYQNCLENFGASSRWIAFIDLDEFLFAPGQPDLREALAAYEAFPGVVVNWQIYGSSHHQRRPQGLVTENFTMRAETQWIRNARSKSMVDPSRTLNTTSAHDFIYRDGALAVTENFEPVRLIEPADSAARAEATMVRGSGDLDLDKDPYAVKQFSVTSVSVNKLRINHYAVKSRDEFEDKVKRFAEPMKGAGRYHHIDKIYFPYHDRNEVHDPILHRYLAELKAALPSSAG